MKQTSIKYIALALPIIIIDQLTKHFAYNFERIYTVTSWLSFEKTINRGVSWGLFNSSDARLFMGVTIATIIITMAVAIYGYRCYKMGHAIWGETLLCTGSISNIIDRFWYNGVVDFIHLHYQQYSWPLFNIADICIVLGVAILFFTQIRE